MGFVIRGLHVLNNRKRSNKVEDRFTDRLSPVNLLHKPLYINSF